MLALDPAASEFYKDGKYVFKKSDNRELSSEEMAAYWTDWCDKYPIISIEDGMAENDWDGWKNLTEMVGERVQLVGDDLFVTNVQFLQRGIDEGCGKFDPHQGQPDRHADRNARRHRACPDEQYDRRHLAPFGRNRRYVYRRSRRRDQRRPDQDRQPCRSDRIAKYNQLLRIEEDLGDSARYPGRKAFYQIRKSS